MNTLVHTFSITDLRQKTNSLLNTVAENGYVLISRRSKPKAALVDYEYLQALQDAYEEYLDVKEYDETIKLKRISLSDHMKSME